MSAGSARGRWVAGGLAILLAAGGLAGWVVIALLPGYLDFETDSVLSAGTSLRVRATNARIELAASVDDRIQVTARGWYRGVHQRPAIGASTAGQVTAVDARCPEAGRGCRLAVTVTVPAELPVRVDAAGGSVEIDRLLGPLQVRTDTGSIQVAGAAGPLTLDSDNGSISVDDCRSGRVSAQTRNGGIDASFTRPPEVVTVRNVNGSIDLAVPATAGYQVSASSVNGPVKVELPADSAGPHAITAGSVNGAVTVSPRE